MSWIPGWLSVDGEVERISGITDGQFAELLESGEPKVLEGEFADSLATARWTLGYLRETCGKATVRVFVSIGDDYSVDIDSTSGTRKEIAEMTMDEFAARMSGEPGLPPIIGEGERLYLLAFPAQLFDGMLAELPEPRLLRGEHYGPVRTNFWIAPAEFVTLAHSDPFHDNLLAQIHGVKRLLIWDPKQAPLLYLNTFGEPNHGRSKPNLMKPDFDLFPLLKQAHALEVCLNPGDVLYIPEAWIHYVYTESLSISVNYWFALRTEFQKALGEMDTQFRKLRPDLRSFYSYMLRVVNRHGIRTPFSG
jgi:Cupin-like domain